MRGKLNLIRLRVFAQKFHIWNFLTQIYIKKEVILPIFDRQKVPHLELQSVKKISVLSKIFRQIDKYFIRQIDKRVKKGVMTNFERL